MVIFTGGALVVTALLVVAIVGGLSTKHSGGHVASSDTAKGSKTSKTTESVTTTTSHAEAIDQLLSQVSMSPADG